MFTAYVDILDHRGRTYQFVAYGLAHLITHLAYIQSVVGEIDRVTLYSLQPEEN